MRKILLFLAIALITAFVANFSLWYLNNRLIVKTLEDLKETLKHKDVEFEYETIIFDTFKSWDLDGAIIGLKIIRKPYGYFFTSQRVEFEYEPFKGALVFKATGNNEYGFRHPRYNTEFFVKFPESQPPALRVKIGTANVELGKAIGKSLTSGNISELIDIEKIALDINDLIFIDKRTNDFAQSLKGLALTISNVHENKENSRRVSNITGNVTDWVMYPDYKPDFDKEGIHGKFAQVVGPSNIMFQAQYILPDKENNKGPGRDLTYKLDSFNYWNDKFRLDANGTLSHSSKVMMPSFDFNLALTNFSFVFDYYINYLNEVFRQTSRDLAYVKLEQITDQQRANVKALISQFANSSDQLTINLKTTENGEILISEKPLKDILLALQVILFQKAGEQAKKSQQEKIVPQKDTVEKKPSDSNAKQPLTSPTVNPNPMPAN